MGFVSLNPSYDDDEDDKKQRPLRDEDVIDFRSTNRGTAMPSATVSRVSLLAMCALFTGEPADAQLATDMKLEDAGFVMRRADTPEKLARLRVIPPRQFVTRIGKSGRYYLWADPDTCRCVFVGHDGAFKSFRDMQSAGLPQPDSVSPPGIAPERMIIHDMDRDAGIGVPDDDILDYRF